MLECYKAQEYFSMRRYNILIVLHSLLSCICRCLSDTQVCYPPNKPHGGDYSPHKNTYEVGDIIEYHCNRTFFPLSLTSSVNPHAVCQVSGTWSTVQNTFCDGSLTPHVVVLMERKESRNGISSVTDGDIKSCESTLYVNRITWLFSLGRPSFISVVRIYGVTGEKYRLEVIVQRGSLFGENQISCGFQTVNMTRNDPLVYRCPEGTEGDKVFVKDWTRIDHILSICEVEIFAKTVSSCEPPAISIPYGYLEYKRESAILVCTTAYKRSINQDIMCRKSVWQTNGHLCASDGGDTAQSVVLILSAVLGAVVILIVILTVILVICKRVRYSRKVTTVSSSNSTSRSYFSTAKEDGTGSGIMNSRSLGANEDPEEHEYSTVRYSNLIPRVQLPSRMPIYANYSR